MSFQDFLNKLPGINSKNCRYISLSNLIYAFHDINRILKENKTIHAQTESTSRSLGFTSLQQTCSKLGKARTYFQNKIIHLLGWYEKRMQCHFTYNLKKRFREINLFNWLLLQNCCIYCCVADKRQSIPNIKAIALPYVETQQSTLLLLVQFLIHSMT